MRSPCAILVLALGAVLAPMDAHGQAPGPDSGVDVGVGGDSSATPAAAEGPTDGFPDFQSAYDFAQNSYMYGDYLDVVQTLRPRLLPNAPEGLEGAGLLRAYTLLGTAAHFESLGGIADAAFLEILLRDPRFRLDPLLYPPRVIERFEAVREVNSDRLNALMADDEVSSTLYIEQQIREQSRLVSMLPFGYGFFSSDRDIAGFSYAVGQLALGGTMIGLYMANEIARGQDGYFEDPDRARARGTAQVVSASAFSALVLVNVIHGAVTHDRSRRIEYRTLTEPPPELRSPEGSSRSRGWDFSFAPLFASP